MIVSDLGVLHLGQQVEDHAFAQAAAADVQRTLRGARHLGQQEQAGGQQADALDVESEVERGTARGARDGAREGVVEA